MMNRKKFLKTSAVASLGFVAFPSFYSCKQAKEKARVFFNSLQVNAGSLDIVRGNVSRYVNRGGSVGVLETPDGFLVIDAQFPDSIQPLIDSIANIEGKPIEYLCNTHHHGDHTAGNIAFKELTSNIVAQEKVPIYQKLRAEENEALDKQLYANNLFDKELKISFGNENITGYHYGAGHTFGDAIYHFESDNVVHMGDLIFNQTIPVFRVKDGSNAAQWVNILDTVIDKFDDDTQFIFGHSHDAALTIGKIPDLVDMKSFLEASNDFVELEVVKNGKTPEQMVKEFQFIPGFESRKTMWATHWDDFMTNLATSVQPS